MNELFEPYPNLEYNLTPTLEQRDRRPVITDALVDRPKMNENVTIQWREKDIKALEDFCKLHGIEGFRCGYMSPVAALAMLKNKLGIVDNSSEERPIGYEQFMKSDGHKVLLSG
jgi:hypothetical protein